MLRSVGVAMLAIGVAAAVTPVRAEVERPPQFVMLAFDNCTELERWRDLADFAAEMNRDRDRLHFTFFVSGINFIEDANRGVYQGPGSRRGYSRISFGGNADAVRERVDYINVLAAHGHEIASHAVGHFNGGHWSASQWQQEFQSWRDLLTNAVAARDTAVQVNVPAARVIGFRAPYLATSPGLYETLRRDGFRYDTSGVSYPDQWPQKLNDLWRFNLAAIRIDGLGRRALSMDYNFLVAQSHGVTDVRRAGTFRAQMLATYLDYFRANYTGNRAPLQIGHHFESYQGGVYNEALKDFARQVCGLPEVRCAAYGELADFMDQQSPDMLAAYQRGDFPHAALPAQGSAAAHAPSIH
jgi:peptidoglycan/xylan/chitin deacetylase (PgdA/CDA1 family)